MDKMTKDEFKRRMRAAEIEKRIKEADRKPVIVDQHGEIQEIPETEGTVTIPEETPKRRPGRPKKERVAAEPEANVKAKKPGRKPKEKTETAPKKPERKPKTEKPQVAAEPTESRHEDEMDSLRFLIGVARGRTSEIIHNAEAHIKTGQKLTDLAEVYDTHIRRVEGMLR